MEWFAIPASAVRASLANDPRVSGVALRKAFLKCWAMNVLRLDEMKVSKKKTRTLP